MAHAAAWMNTGGTTLVDSAVPVGTDGTFTSAGHGLTDGVLVTFSNAATGAVGVLIADADYYVRNATTDDFQVSDTPGGEIITPASAGSADVYTAGPEYAAAVMRRLDAVTLHPASVDRFGAREGVRPHSTAAVTMSGTQYTVAESLLTVYPRETSTSGPYRVAVDLTQGTVNAADGSNPRIDALDVQVEDDDEDGSSQRRARVVYTAGTPASSPAAPADVAGAFRIATILVPAGGSPAPSIDSEGQFNDGPGVLPVRTAAERPSTGVHEGTYIDQWDTDILYRWDGSAFAAVASATQYDYWLATTSGAAVTDWTDFTSTVTGGGTATFSSTDGSWIRIAPRTVMVELTITVSAAGSGTGLVQFTTPTAPDRTRRLILPIAIEGASGGGSNSRLAVAVSLTGGTGTKWDRIRYEDGGPTNDDDNVTGATLVSGMTITIAGVYREAT